MVVTSLKGQVTKVTINCYLIALILATRGSRSILQVQLVVIFKL